MSSHQPTRAAVLLAAALASSAAVADAQVPDSPEAAEVLALDQAWIDAEVGHDRAALERILDEGFLATFSSGDTIDRTAFIAAILKEPIPPFQVLHEAVRVHGDVAVVIDTSTNRKTKYTWIAVKRDGRWRAISETVTRVATAAP